MDALKNKNNEKLSATAIQFPENLSEIMGGMSDISAKIGQAKTEDEKKKIIDEFDIDIDPLMQVLKENMENERERIKDKIPEQKKKIKSKIEIHKNLLKILESVDIQNPKITELIQKENEMVDLLNKQLESVDRFYSIFLFITDELSIMIDKENLEKEIETLTKELITEGILLDM